MALNDVEIKVGLQDNVSLPLKKIESSIIRFVGAISAAIASAQAIAFPLRQAAEFEQAMLSVAKTTNFSEAAIKSLSGSILELSTELDVAAVDLANIAAIAGQLGLGTQGAEGIAAFTETTARFSSVLDVTVETAAEGLAKISNIFNISLKEAEKISSAFNEVSNTSTASGQALLDIVRRLGNAGRTISLEQSLGLAASGVDFGLTLETIGTSFTKIFSNMQSRAGQFAEFMGTSTEDWAATVERDGVTALQLYLNKLLQVDSTTRAYTVRTLSGGGRIFSLVNKLIGDAANGYEILGKNIGNAGAAFESGTSSIEEHERVLTGVIAKLKILGNTITKLATEIGNLSLPFLKTLAEDLQTFFSDPNVKDGFTQLAEGIGNIGSAIVDTIKWIAELNINWANLANVLKLIIGFKIAKYFVALSTAIAAHGAKVAGLIGTWSAFGTTVKTAIVGGVAGVSTTAASSLARFGTASAGAQKKFLSGWEKTLTRLQTVNQNYDRSIRNVYRNNAATIANYTQQLARPGANIVQLNNRIAGVRKSQATQVLNLNRRRREEVRLLEQSVYWNQKSALAMRATAGPIAQATGFFGKLFAAIKLVGGGLLRFLIGPWGIMLTLLASSLGLFGKVGDAITRLGGFLGFSTKEQQDLARAMRISAAEAKAQEEEIRGLADAYVQLSKAQGGFKFGGAQSLVNTEGVKGIEALPDQIGISVQGVNARLEELSINANNARRSVAAISEEVNANQDQLVASGNRLKQAYEDLQSVSVPQRQAAQEVIREETARLKILGKQGDALKAQRKQLQNIIDDYESGFDPKKRDALVSEGVPTPIGDEILQRQSELLAVQQAMAAGASEISVKSAEASLRYREMAESLEDAKKAKESFLEEDFDAETAETSAIQARDEKIRSLDNAIAHAAASLAVAEGLRAEFAEEAAAGGLSVDAQFGRALIEQAKTIEDARDALTTLKGTSADKFISDLTQETIKNLTINVGWLEQNEDMIRSLKRVSEEATRMKDRIHDAFKNVDKDIEALKAPLADLDREIEQIQKQRVFDRNLEKDQKFVNDTFDRAIEKTRQLKEARIDAARAAGDNRRADALQKELDNSIAFAESQRDYLNTTKAANAELGKMAETVTSLNTVNKELQDLSSQADAASVSGDAAELSRLADLIAKKRSEAEQLNKILADSRTKFAEGEFDVGEGVLQRSAIPDAELDKVVAKADSINTQIGEAFRTGLDTLDKAADAVVAPIVNQYEALATKAKQTKTEIATLADSLNLTESDLEKIRSGWEGVGNILEGVATQLNNTNIDEVIGALNGIDKAVFENAERQLVGQAEAYASVVQTIVSDSAGEAIKSVDGTEVNLKGDMDAVDFMKQAQANVDAVDERIKLKGVVTDLEVAGNQSVNVAGAANNARGGYIAGPGSGTSDSILSWLSNGEYVVDAMTTRMFGSGFFKTLQSIARSGAGTTKGLMGALNLPGFSRGGAVSYKMGLPAFAGGGLVDALDSGLGNLVKDLAVAQGATPEVSERVELALAVGGEQYTVQGSRDQVKGLVEALKDSSRSLRRL